jgi:hypothetical protein
VAGRIREELGVEVDLLQGPYGQATVLVDGAVVARTNWTGWLPPGRTVLERVKAKLAG